MFPLKRNIRRTKIEGKIPLPPPSSIDIQEYTVHIIKTMAPKNPEEKKIQRRIIREWEKKPLPPNYIPLFTTVFTQHTWEENQNFKKQKNISFNTSIYGVPKLISNAHQYQQQYPHGILLEMNNTTNRIMGIAIIKLNQSIEPSRIPIYENPHWNRYTYYGIHYISRTDFTAEENSIFDVLDFLCMTGHTHCKRNVGICRFSSALLYRMEMYYLQMKQLVNNIEGPPLLIPPFYEHCANINLYLRQMFINRKK